MKPEKHGSQMEEAYWHLRQEIVDGNLQPSEKLRIDFLRDQYKFGASALREAMSRLVSDGLVESEAQRGFWVARIGPDEFRDIINARKTIEVDALRQSMKFGKLDWEERVVAARHSLERVETSMTEATPEVVIRWERQNRQFHMALISGCPSKWLIRFTEQLYDQSQRYRHRTVLRRPIPRRGLSAEHKEIVEATLDRQVERACTALARHIENTAQATEKAIFPPSAPVAPVKRTAKKRPVRTA
jgi:GntR family carbon starvation induced transcriptional regulator